MDSPARRRKKSIRRRARVGGTVVGFVVVPLAASGCTDLLGLDGLKFDRQPITSSGGSDASVAGGGAPPTTLSEAFPRRLGAGKSLFAAAGRDASFHAYDPLTGEVETLVVTPTGVSSTSRPFVAGLDRVLEFVDDGEPSLFGYEAATGLVHLARGFSNGAGGAPETSTGTPGWTHVEQTETSAGVPHVFAYDATTGHSRFGAFDPGISSEKVLAEFEAGLSVLLPYFDGERARLITARDSGAFESWELAPDGVWESSGVGSLSPSPRVVRFVRAGEDAFVVYDSVTGRAKSGSFSAPSEIGPGGTSGLPPTVAFAAIDDAVWPEQLTSLTPFTREQRPFVAAYNDVSGVLDVYSLDPLEDSSPVVVR